MLFNRVRRKRDLPPPCRATLKILVRRMERAKPLADVVATLPDYEFDEPEEMPPRMCGGNSGAW